MYKLKEVNIKCQHDTKYYLNKIKNILIKIICIILFCGISYVILGPIIGIVSNSFFSDSDKMNKMIYILPQNPTLERYSLAIKTLNYNKVIFKSLAFDLIITFIQLFICSMVGYGFARFDFPFKKFLFACVVIMIIIPTHSVMLPIYITFQNFNPLGIMGLFGKSNLNLLNTSAPLYIMTLLGCGLRSGIYIYIFNQFYRGLPKEIEEAAFVDGAGLFYTYLRVMLPNAIPAVTTVSIFSLVWQYNDTFYARLFNISDSLVISKKVSSLMPTITNNNRIIDPLILRLYLDAGIVLVILPLIIIYVLLQKKFVEGVERSGIVG